jgi:hypothetical protein
VYQRCAIFPTPIVGLIRLALNPAMGAANAVVQANESTVATRVLSLICPFARLPMARARNQVSAIRKIDDRVDNPGDSNHRARCRRRCIHPAEGT